MALVVEPRHRVVRLRLQPGSSDASGGERLEDREAAAAGHRAIVLKEFELAATEVHVRIASPPVRVAAIPGIAKVEVGVG